MQPHLSNLQFLIGGFVLIIVTILALAAFLDLRGKRKATPFQNYFCSDFDQDQFDQDNPQQSSYSTAGEWSAYNEARVQAYEDRTRTMQKNEYE
jgi:hypothetical protein